MTQPLPRIDTFEDLWNLYKATPRRDIIVTNVIVKGTITNMPMSPGHFFADTGVLPEPLRREVVREMASATSFQVQMGGSVEKQSSRAYWDERLWRVSQAARALKRLMLHKAF